MNETERPHHVDVWYADLANREWQSERWLSTLSSDERARAELFRFAVHRRRYRSARVLLRRILGTYLGREPASLRFSLNAYGKPRLSDVCGHLDVHFNVSHSDELGVFAVSKARAVGVDVEAIRELPDLVALAHRFFAPSEASVVCASPERSKPHMFFRCWTRKEAFVKACGEGLSIPLDSFEVSPDSEGPIPLVRGCETALTSWTVVDLQPPSNFAGSLAVEGNTCEVTSGWWPVGLSRSLSNLAAPSPNPA